MSLHFLMGRVGARLRSWLCAVAKRNRLEAEMEAELACHLEFLTADLMRAGYGAVEAGRRARIAMGASTVHKEEMRASLGLRWWDEFWADLRYGVRILRKSPGFTAIAATSLALAIGANTTIFSVAKSLLYDRLHVPHAEQLRLLRWNGDGHEVVHAMWGDFDSTPEGGTTSSVFSYPVYQDLRDHHPGMQQLFAFKQDTMNGTVAGIAQRVEVEMVSGNYYSGLGVRPALGRALEPSDDFPGRNAVAVIGDSLWQREFGRSPLALGQTITVNQAQLTIVGVNPPGFTGAKNVQASPDLFVPLTLQPLIDPKRGNVPALADPELWWVNVMGRIEPGVQEAQARAALDAELAAVVRGTMHLDAGDTMPHLALADGSRGLHYTDQMFRKPAYVLTALSGFVLLLACANIANLLLARGAQRQREMSVRLALGAGRGRVLRQLLTESLLLAAIGGIGGLLLGYLGRNAIPRLLSNAWDQNEFHVSFDWGVFGFAAGVTLLTGLLFGLAPAWLAARREVSASLKEGSQTATRRSRGLGGKAIVVFQIAISTLLVVGAGLFLRTLLALNAVDVGFNTENLVLFRMDTPKARYPGNKSVELQKRLEQGFAALPGIEAASSAESPYLAETLSNATFLPEGEKSGPQTHPAEDVNQVGSDFFQALGIPVLAGRGFGSQDTETSPRVAVINEALARKRFPNQNPIGKRFRMTEDASGDWVQIVGICGDTHYTDLRNEAPAQFFVPYVQLPDAYSMTYVIRTRQSLTALAPGLRRVVQSIDRDLPMIDMRTQREQIDATMQMERMFAALTTGFGLLALALACVGIYGVMAYSVASRKNEIGIRMALGAQPAQVRSMILAESLWLTAAGIATGVAAALLLTRLVRTMLYGVQPWDPSTLAAGVSVLLAVALAASWTPARRAAGVQPMEALRHE
jgi:predicted permease